MYAPYMQQQTKIYIALCIDMLYAFMYITPMPLTNEMQGD